MEHKTKIINYQKLPIPYRIECYRYARKMGYRYKEILKLDFQIKGNQIVGILDKYLLSDIFPSA